MQRNILLLLAPFPFFSIKLYVLDFAGIFCRAGRLAGLCKQHRFPHFCFCAITAPGVYTPELPFFAVKRLFLVFLADLKKCLLLMGPLRESRRLYGLQATPAREPPEGPLPPAHLSLLSTRACGALQVVLPILSLRGLRMTSPLLWGPP